MKHITVYGDTISEKNFLFASPFTTELQVTQFTLDICNTVDLNERSILTDIRET